MRVGVIGAGAVGGTLAALLAHAGHDVAVTARGPGLAAIRAHGIVLSGDWSTHRATVTATETLTEAPDLALVAVKATQLGAALEANRDSLESVTVLTLQNGLESLDTAARLLPGSDCLGGLALFAASLTGPGRIEVTAHGTLAVGRGTGASPASARRVARVLEEALPTTAVDNFTGCQWTKLLINQVNALPALTGLSVQETVRDRRLRRILTASLREAARVGLATGVRFGRLQGLDHRILRLVAHSPLTIAQLLPRAMSQRMGARPNPGSTLQSIRRGQQSEIDYLNGAVVAAARDAGREAPVNAALTALVHEVEATGTHLTIDEVAARTPRHG